MTLRRRIESLEAKSGTHQHAPPSPEAIERLRGSIARAREVVKRNQGDRAEERAMPLAMRLKRAKLEEDQAQREVADLEAHLRDLGETNPPGRLASAHLRLARLGVVRARDNRLALEEWARSGVQPYCLRNEQ